MAQAPAFSRLQVAIHRVLIERDEHIDLVAHVAHRRLAGADGQERMPAADDGLVGVVGVEVKPAPREDAGENVAGGGDALAVLPPDGDREIYSIHYDCFAIERIKLPVSEANKQVQDG